LILQFILAVGLAILISALCSVLEAALYSLSLSHIELMGRKHAKAAHILKKLKQDVDQPITAILTLNTIAHTIGAAVAGASAAAIFGEGNLIWFSILFTLAILLLSEILPKTAGVVYSRPLAPYIAAPLQGLVFILRPIIWVCMSITRLIPQDARSNRISAEELQTIAMLSRESGEIEVQQEMVITNILQLRKKNVRQVMTPRTVTFALRKDMTVKEAMAPQEKWTRHSRVPLYDKDFDNIVGVALSKDVFRAAIEEKMDLPLSALMHPVHFVPETAPLNRVLIEFFERHQHLFVVVDEYGAVTGVITLEDIIEEIVGREIVDESDEAQDMRELARKRKKRLGRAGPAADDR